METKTMLLIFNPTSGQQLFPPNLFEVVDKFTKSGFLVTAYPTQAAGDVFHFLMEHSGAYEYVVCSGGDGTLNEAIDALMLMERRPIFGYIPSGTTNDFATSLGLPRDILEAAGVITTGRARPFDIGRFGGEYFSYVAAFGLFTDVSYGTSQSMKNYLGQLAYLLEGVKRLGSIESYACTVLLEDGEGREEIQGEFILGIVTNSMSVGGFKLLDESLVKMDDGLFEVALLQKPRNFIDLQNVIASLLNQELYTQSLLMRRARRLTVRADQPIAWTLDGEFGGRYDSVDIENCHKAIEIMMPIEQA